MLCEFDVCSNDLCASYDRPDLFVMQELLICVVVREGLCLRIESHIENLVIGFGLDMPGFVHLVYKSSN